MAAFLKAEEMSSNKNYSESQILNTVQQIQSRPLSTKNQPNNHLTLSMEEQNVKNSILRLNERLNSEFN